MKFYIISIILNVMALFIPAVYYNPGSKRERNKHNEVVTVNLNENVFNNTSKGEEQKSDKSNFSDKNDKNREVYKKDIYSQLSQKENLSEISRVQRKKQGLENSSTFLQNKRLISKVSKSDKKTSVSKTLPVPNVQSSQNSDKIAKNIINSSPSEAVDKTDQSIEKISRNAIESSFGNSVKSLQRSGRISRNGDDSLINSENAVGVKHLVQRNGTEGTGSIRYSHKRLEKTLGKSNEEAGEGRKKIVGSREGKNTDVCNEGKDFTVSYNPNLKYPVAAQRLGNKGDVVVMVRLRFNSGGSVSVVSASGGSGVFQQEAKSAASRIRVNIKNPDTLKCTISKPFKFELK